MRPAFDRSDSNVSSTDRTWRLEVIRQLGRVGRRFAAMLPLTEAEFRTIADNVAPYMR